MKVAVLQSNYIPWKGYFDIIHGVDSFVFYDDVQYTKNSWRNRNKILTSAGQKWLTVPVGKDENRLICEVKMQDKSWQEKHFQIIEENYCKAPYYYKYKEFLQYALLERKWDYLYQLNRFFIKSISNFLGISTKFLDSMDFTVHGVKEERLINLLKAVGATEYLSGTAAKDYIVPEHFTQAGIELIWQNYDGYPEYKQSFEPFCHNVSILDLLFNTGDDAPYYIWGWREEK